MEFSPELQTKKNLQENWQKKKNQHSKSKHCLNLFALRCLSYLKFKWQKLKFSSLQIPEDQQEQRSGNFPLKIFSRCYVVIWEEIFTFGISP